MDLLKHLPSTHPAAPFIATTVVSRNPVTLQRDYTFKVPLILRSLRHIELDRMADAWLGLHGDDRTLKFPLQDEVNQIAKELQAMITPVLAVISRDFTETVNTPRTVDAVHEWWKILVDASFWADFILRTLTPEQAATAFLNCALFLHEKHGFHMRAKCVKDPVIGWVITALQGRLARHDVHTQVKLTYTPDAAHPAKRAVVKCEGLSVTVHGSTWKTKGG